MNIRGFLPVVEAVLALAAVLLLSDCPLTPEEDQSDIPEVEPEPRSELFEEQEDSEGTFVFLTSDPDLRGPYGCTLWALTGSGQEPFVERELELAKLSGNGSAGFGAILCHREDGEWGETMLVVMINTNRQFIIGEAIGAEFQKIVPWTDCEALFSGSVVNRMRIQREGEIFKVFFNGQETVSFHDEQAPLHSGGADGLIVVISPLDRFPETAVHVVFKERK